MCGTGLGGRVGAIYNITGFEPVQRVGIYLDREFEEEDKKRNFQQKPWAKNPEGLWAYALCAFCAKTEGNVHVLGKNRSWSKRSETIWRTIFKEPKWKQAGEAMVGGSGVANGLCESA